jgi:DNA-binding response OmpR family regulator
MPSNSKILVLDDEVELRALLQRYLTQQGFEVRAIGDILILDIMIRGEDGLSVCQGLRSQKETIPIIMLTARGEAVDRILGREASAGDYLPKPFDPRELLACMVIRRNQKVERSRPLSGERVGMSVEDEGTEVCGAHVSTSLVLVQHSLTAQQSVDAVSPPFGTMESSPCS